MPTVAEILKQSGLTDEQINALDAKVIAGFNTALITAEQERKAATESATKAEEERKTAAEAVAKAAEEREKAEIERRSNRDFYDSTIAPALNGWEDERKKIEGERVRAAAEAAFYKTQAEQAKAGGFIASDSPQFTFTVPAGIDPPRDNGGRYVANAPGSTPGSPTLVDDVRTAFSDSTWAMQEHQRLYGTFLPDDVTIIAKEAEFRKLPFRDYVAQKYNYAGRRDEMRRKAQEEHDNGVRAEQQKTFDAQLADERKKATDELEKARKEWAERAGSNPDVRGALPSQMETVQRAVKAGDRPDPLKLNPQERHRMTRQQINERITEQGANAA